MIYKTIQQSALQLCSYYQAASVLISQVGKRRCFRSSCRCVSESVIISNKRLYVRRWVVGSTGHESSTTHDDDYPVSGLLHISSRWCKCARRSMGFSTCSHVSTYNGWPSMGCENCRKAKKRCDQALPSCDRCARLAKSCGGYRDIADLMFKDESKSITE
ncbi:hypothetical protein AC579_3653 [Pseudocercospora musae]|uniref:Zn(2)-C6 fungal-type domain-containing protein n=1 Tax=Pseudocercospora musae TaxID=113226 RepID=A0A139IJ93_9PEZI|nr:hypothetical protein AC579_3653 [Pseudocercospora musae]KXT14617.1 hypothetical protein AC579_3653 [Pseudocercospora musae]KXT14618.1 hypothetical protein AC579_3653 [Pseudocercospora musae]